MTRRFVFDRLFAAVSAVVVCVALVVGTAGATSADADAKFAAGMTAARAGDFATALTEWLPLAEDGHRAAQYNLALMYERGAGVALDPGEAMRWYGAAAEQGHGYAQYKVGLALQRGVGAGPDVVMAYAWFARAAEQLVPGAAYEMGYAHHEGDGAPRDLSLALEWFWIAARLGYAEAIPARNHTEREVPPEVARRAFEDATAWLTERGWAPR